MKVYRKLFAVLLAGLLLAGCAQTKPGETTEPTAKAPTVPTTAPTTAPTTEPAAAPTEVMTAPQTEDAALLPEEMLVPVPTDLPEMDFLEYGHLFVGSEGLDIPGIEDCRDGDLYFWDPVSAGIHLITDRGIYTDPEIPVDILACSYQYDLLLGAYLFYVPEDAPNELYAVPTEDLSRHILLYTAPSGPITDLHILRLRDGSLAVEWVEDHRRFLRYSFSTGEAQVLMEQPYIIYANSEYRDEVTALSGKKYYCYNENRIYFYGKPSGDSELSGYLYFRDVEACTKLPY